MMFVSRKDGNRGFCVVYGKRNAMIERDTYPLPRMGECTDSLLDATIFSTIECSSGCWQTKIPEADRDRATFPSYHELLRLS